VRGGGNRHPELFTRKAWGSHEARGCPLACVWLARNNSPLVGLPRPFPWPRNDVNNLKTTTSMTQFAASSFLLLSTMLIGMINLAAPFVTKEDSKIRDFLLLTVSGFFLFNVIIIDYLFINGTKIEFTLLDLGKYSISFALEPLGVIFLTLLAVLWIPALLYTIKFIAVNKFQHSSRYLLFVNSAVLAGCFVALSSNLITMFIGYELLTLCTIPLIIHQQTTKSLAGLFKYLKILMISGLLLFLPAIIIIYANTNTGTFVGCGFIKPYFSDTMAICLLLAFVFGISKTALYPLHGWLPAAMVASYPISALLHAVVVVKTGLFCTYKILFYVFGLEYLQYLFSTYNWLVILPAITILYSSVAAIRSTEIKMILAYSTINQLSIALISAFLITPMAMKAAVMHMVAHAFTKICLFYAAGNFYSLNRTYYVNQLAGISKTMPKTSLVMLIACLSLIGMPPFAGFFSKAYIMSAAAASDNLFVMIILTIGTIFTSIYVIRILLVIYKPVELPREGGNNENTLPTFMFISLGICLSGLIGFYFARYGINILLKTFEGLLPSPGFADVLKQFVIALVAFFIMVIWNKSKGFVGNVFKKYLSKDDAEKGAKEPWNFESLEDQILSKISIFHNQQTAIFVVFLFFITLLIAALI